MSRTEMMCHEHRLRSCHLFELKDVQGYSREGGPGGHVEVEGGRQLGMVGQP